MRRHLPRSSLSIAHSSTESFFRTGSKLTKLRNITSMSGNIESQNSAIDAAAKSQQGTKAHPDVTFPIGASSRLVLSRDSCTEFTNTPSWTTTSPSRLHPHPSTPKASPPPRPSHPPPPPTQPPHPRQQPQSFRLHPPQYPTPQFHQVRLPTANFSRHGNLTATPRRPRTKTTT